MASAEDNKKVVRAIEEAWDSGKLDELSQHFSPTFHNHSGVPGMPSDIETLKMVHGQSMGAMPDRKVEILDMVGEGDKVVVRCRCTGTNKGGFPFFGVAEPNNAKIEFEFIGIYRLEGGKVVEHWGVNDGTAILAQIGAWTPPPMPGA